MKTHYIWHWFLCLLMVLGVTACGSNKKKELEPVELSSVEAEISVDTLWSRKIGSGQGDYYQQFVLAVDEDFIYAASENGKVFKLDRLTGKKQWKVSVEGSLTAGVAVDDRHVYVGLLDGSLLALDRNDGRQVWSRHVSSEIVSAPSAAMGHLVVQVSNGEIISLDPATGDIRWRHGSATPALTLRGNSRPRFFAGYVVAGLANGKLVVLDVSTGQAMWEPKVADPKGDTEIERIVDVDATPVISADQLLAVSMQGRLVSYDLKTGRLLWAVEESSFREMDVDGNQVYVSNVDGIVTAYDLATGAMIWSNEDLLRRKVSAPRVVGRYIVVADYEGYMHLLSQTDGRIVARKRVAWEPVKSPALVDEDRFYIIAINGRLKAYQLGDLIE